MLSVKLKEDFHVSLEKKVPGKMQMSTSLEFITEKECAWFVDQLDEKLFKDYTGKTKGFDSTKKSLTSALIALSKNGKTASDLNRIPFKIYQVPE